MQQEAIDVGMYKKGLICGGLLADQNTAQEAMNKFTVEKVSSLHRPER